MKALLIIFTYIIFGSFLLFFIYHIISGDTNSALYGCLDSDATNYNMYATINDGSCTLQDSECLFDINAIDINPSNYEFNGSVTCSIVMDGESVGSVEITRMIDAIVRPDKTSEEVSNYH